MKFEGQMQHLQLLLKVGSLQSRGFSDIIFQLLSPQKKFVTQEESEDILPPCSSWLWFKLQTWSRCNPHHFWCAIEFFGQSLIVHQVLHQNQTVVSIAFLFHAHSFHQKRVHFFKGIYKSIPAWKQTERSTKARFQNVDCKQTLVQVTNQHLHISLVKPPCMLHWPENDRKENGEIKWWFQNPK
jgi:hypothetical protein